MPTEAVRELWERLHHVGTNEQAWSIIQTWADRAVADLRTTFGPAVGSTVVGEGDVHLRAIRDAESILDEWERLESECMRDGDRRALLR